MDTKMMEQFSIMDDEILTRIEGGIFGIDDGLIWSYVISQTVSAGIKDLTKQCENNPHQWFCVQI